LFLLALIKFLSKIPWLIGVILYMSVQFNSLNAFIQKLPIQITQKAMQGALATAAIKISSGASGNMALAGAGIAASLTLTDALMRPVFKNIFPQDNLTSVFVNGVFFATFYGFFQQAAGRCMGTPYKVSNLFLIIAGTFFLNNEVDFRNRAFAYIV